MALRSGDLHGLPYKGDLLREITMELDTYSLH